MSVETIMVSAMYPCGHTGNHLLKNPVGANCAGGRHREIRRKGASVAFDNGSQIIGESLTRDLEEHGLFACLCLSEVFDDPGPIGSELKQKFHGAISDIKSIRFQNLPSDHGAFSIRNGTLSLDEEPVKKILHFASKDMRDYSVDHDA